MKTAILSALLVILALTGCRQQTQEAASANLQIDLRVEPEEPVTGDATLIVTVTDSAGNPVIATKVSARGDMNHAGMTPVIKDAEPSDGGEYSIPFEWTMAGDWTVEITVELADGTKVSQTFEESVASGPGKDSMNMDMGDMDMTAEATEAMDMGESSN
ncbi:MAG: FixH family protein [Anaerolineae bacterium]|nr:FixH family protein [Anaerolineae bacterium]